MKDSVFGPVFSLMNEGSFMYYSAKNYPNLPNRKLASAISDTSVVGIILIKM
jgi:hypothetical protein